MNTPFDSNDPAAIPIPGQINAANEPVMPVDCWNIVGVTGNRSCPTLATHIHCRNCPVYAQAGMRLLDRHQPDGYRREWSQLLSRKRRPHPPAEKSVVVFQLDAELLALPTFVFQEVQELPVIHSLPHRRTGPVLGLVNFRGELLVCVSLGHALGSPEPATAATLRALYSKLIITSWKGQRLGIPVSKVIGVVHYNPADLKDPPSTGAKARMPCTHGVLLWQNKTVGCLDEGRLFEIFNQSLS